MLPLAAATFGTVSNLATSRAERNEANELYEGTPTSVALRTAAHLLSLTFVVAIAIALMGVMFVYMLVDAPVGTPRVSEPLSGPFTIASGQAR